MSLEGKTVEEIQALAELANELASDPKTRQHFLHLTKMANPNTSIPEIDIPANMRAAMIEPLKQLDALTRRQEERDLQDSIMVRRQEMMAKGVRADEIQKLEKLMVDKGIANHDTALEHLRMSERAAAPTPAVGLPGVRRYETPKMPDMKEFQGDGKAFAYNAAYSVIDELRGRKAAA